LTFELLLAELEKWAELAHKYASIYAYFRAWKSGRQEVNEQINSKKRPKELNCYAPSGPIKVSVNDNGIFR
jgi:hypothetical protein